jgi:ribonuclease HI
VLILAEYSIVFDGGAIGNPGQGYGSFEISGPGDFRVLERLSYSDHGEVITNNEAEYMTLIAALERLMSELGESALTADVTIHGDSMLVINQVNGVWKIKKPHLKQLRDRVAELLSRFHSTQVKWHSRLNSVWVLGH